MITREEIEAAAALASAATPGPWNFKAGSFGGGHANAIWSAHETNDPHTCPLVTSHLHYAPQDAADIELMAASRALIPSLAATCLELLARAEKAEAALALIVDNTDSHGEFEPELAMRTLACVRHIAERALNSKQKEDPK